MIELNCSYEESKKILELGYDFSKVCWIFRKETPSFKMNLLKFDDDFLVYAAPEGESFGDFINRAYSSVTKAIQAGYVPIIPKSALEACLPDLSYSSYVLGWLGHTLCNLDPGEYVPCLITIDKQFNSPYEGFVWCHENYPEELRKKFDEVMG